MTLSDIEDIKKTLTSVGWSFFDTICNEIKGENKHFSNKDIEESALKIMRNHKNKTNYFKNK